MPGSQSAISDIRDPQLAERGLARIQWDFAQMPVLQELEQQLGRKRPLSPLSTQDDVAAAGNCHRSMTDEQRYYLAPWREST